MEAALDIIRMPTGSNAELERMNDALVEQVLADNESYGVAGSSKPSTTTVFRAAVLY